MKTRHIIPLFMLAGCCVVSTQMTNTIADTNTKTNVERKVVSTEFPWVWVEKGRVLCPSGKCELVTYEGDRGAMSSLAYVCFLVKPGQNVDPNNCDYYEPVLSSSHVLPKVRWENNSRLVINTEGGYVGHERPYSREFKVAIEFQNEPLSLQWSEAPWSEAPNTALEPTATAPSVLTNK